MTAFKKTVGLNGVGVKAVNMLSERVHRPFGARRRGPHGHLRARVIEQSDRWESGVEERNGTLISFRVDEEVFGAYAYNMEYVEEMVKNYTYLNLGLTFKLNGQSYVSKNGLLDLLNEKMSDAPLYAPIHLSGDDIEVAITHGVGLRRELLLVRQRAVHLAGRYAPGGLPRGDRQNGQGVLPQGLRCVGHPHVDHRRHLGQGHRPRVRVADQDQAAGRKRSSRASRCSNFVLDFIGKHLDDYLHKHAETAQMSAAEDRREREGAQGDFGHPEEGPRDGQEGDA